MKLSYFTSNLVKYLLLEKKYVNTISYIEVRILIKYFFKILEYNSYSKNYIRKNIILLFNNILDKIRKLRPINHINYKKDFYSKKIFVNKNVLIPRPDTEILIDVIFFYIRKKRVKALELGTGSCSIPIILKLRRPKWELYATDYYEKSLQVAKQNYLHSININFNFFLGNWLAALPIKLLKTFDIIISNPPYISIYNLKKNMGRLKYEPFKSLYAKKNGYFDFIEIIYKSHKYLKKDGILFLEHASYQGKMVRKILFNYKYYNIKTIRDFNNHSRITMGTKK